MNRTQHPSGSRCFSLVELVVVVTILAAIAIIVVPGAFRAVESGNRASCENNRDEIGLWMNMYADDSDKFLPAYENGWVKRIGAVTGIAVDQFAEPEGAFECPSQDCVTYTGETLIHDYWRGTYYGVNHHIMSNLRTPDDKALPHWSQASTQSIPYPSGKIMLADATGGNYYGIEDRDPVVAAISKNGSWYAAGLPPDSAPP